MDSCPFPVVAKSFFRMCLRVSLVSEVQNKYYVLYVNVQCWGATQHVSLSVDAHRLRILQAGDVINR
eukprot:1833802-Amphidinium_carterae.1